MKASVAWINQYLSPGDVTPQQAEEFLTFAGMNIDAVDPIEGQPGDARLEVELTSNRGDCLAHVALAREIAAVSGRGWKPPTPTFAAGTGAAGVALSNTLKNAGCPAFTLTVIKGVRVGPSPAWLKQRLEAIGQRSINNIVDVTNFVLHEMGQPSHVFDLAQVRGGGLTVRAASKGEKLALLDGKTITLSGGEMVICDDNGARPISLAGIMGGSDTSVTDRTVDIALEVATWDPLLVRMAARRHNLRTDSSHRYERYADARTMPAAHARLVELLLQVGGGKVAGDVIADSRTAEPLTQVTLRARTLERVLGINVEPAKVESVLTALGFGVKVGIAGQDAGGGGQWHVTVPAHRHDVKIEVDLVEEVARVVGFDQLVVPEMLPVRVAPLQAVERGRREMTRVLTGAGFYETVTFSFTSAKQAKLFTPAGVSTVTVSDDRRGEENTCRPSVLCGLLACRKANQDARVSAEGGVRLFEVAAVFGQDAKGASTERRMLALATDAPAAGSAIERKQAALRLARGAVDRVIETLTGQSPLITPATSVPAGFDPQASATVSVGGKVVGVIGLASAAATALYDLQQPVALAELEIDALLASYPPRAIVRELPTLPASERDISFVVPEAVRWAQIESLIVSQKPALLEKHAFVGTYRGKPLEAGQKSITLRLTFRDETRTLRDEDVTPQVDALIAAAKGTLGATIRV